MHMIISDGATGVEKSHLLGIFSKCFWDLTLWHLLFNVRITLAAHLGSSFSKSTFGVSSGDQYSVLGTLVISGGVCVVLCIFNMEKGSWRQRCCPMLQSCKFSIPLISGSVLSPQCSFFVAILTFWHHSSDFCFSPCFGFCTMYIACFLWIKSLLWL